MMRHIVTVLMVFGIATSTARAQTGGPKSDPAPDKQPEAKRSAIDEKLLRNSDQGEDLGEEGKPLLRLSHKMQVVEGLLGQGKDADRTEELQKQIVTDIDRLIADIRKHPQSSGSSGGSKGGSQRSNIPQPQGGSNSSAAGSQDSPAQNSSAQLRTAGTAERPDFNELKKQLQDVWGDLPERDREQLFNASGEQFLPKYQSLIEKYFRRLGEARNNGP